MRDGLVPYLRAGCPAPEAVPSRCPDGSLHDGGSNTFLRAGAGTTDFGRSTQGISDEMMLDMQDCLRHLMAVRGALGASLVEYTTGMTVRSAGGDAGTDPQLTAAGVTGLVRASLATAALATVGQPGRVEDIVLTAANGYHLVQFVEEGAGRLVLYVRLDRSLGNLAMARLQLSSVARDLVAE